jgi:2-keto-4-pentenoate hydratase/2-oxohepta-3-ene-1,7-dioic acid hydratase in catechol pathway
MHFITYVYNNCEKIGILSKNKNTVIPLEDIVNDETCNTMEAFIKGFDDYKFKLCKKAEDERTGINIDTVKLEAPIPEPKRGVICLGKNYREHIKEVAKAIDEKDFIPESPIYFNKLVDRAPGQDGIIPFHAQVSTEMDYEVELGVVIGKEGKNIPRDKIEEYIFGYTIVNDISIRDIQRKHTQWFRGKSLDGTCPIGPWIVHKSEIEFPVKLDIKSYVNGELRQDSNTKEFIYDIPYIISEFSQGITLKPGDIISTGTPAGVGMGYTPPKYLRVGDNIECFIERIGTLRNYVK